jgi:hypothetical protein
MAADLHYQKYSVTTQIYLESQDVESNCKSISFYNSGGTGGADMIILGILFTPGMGFAVSGDDGELDTTRYTLRFTGAGLRSCSVIRQQYI